MAHGVLFENVESYDENDGGAPFIRDVTTPAIQKIEEKFGLKPLIVRMYPQDQTDEEDFFWWDHPKSVDDYIVEYAKKNDFIIKPF